jgi:hypothetical protein
MAAIPAPPPSPTLDAIYAALEAAQEVGFREHLGFSGIGNPCERAIWYSFRWATRRSFNGRMLRLFETGHQAEHRFVADLRLAGVEVLEVDPATGKQWIVRDETGHAGGSMDGAALGIIEAPKTWHLTEFKTHNDKSFQKLKADGVQKSKPMHYAQMQGYMHLAGLTRALYLAENKNDSELYAERVRYDAEFSMRLIAKAHRVIAANSPPSRISEDASWFECRFCDHHEVCHKSKLPEAHCRSCLSSTPTDGGKWQCEAHGRTISFPEQLKGCERHLFIPAMVDGEQIDFDEKIGCVTYKMRDGSTWHDGVPF